MASVADGFRSDLEELHKVNFIDRVSFCACIACVRGSPRTCVQEAGLTESRLALLIDSLASGADVFMAGPSGSADRKLESVSGINEMEVILDGTA